MQLTRTGNYACGPVVCRALIVWFPFCSLRSLLKIGCRGQAVAEGLARDANLRQIKHVIRRCSIVCEVSLVRTCRWEDGRRMRGSALYKVSES